MSHLLLEPRTHVRPRITNESSVYILYACNAVHDACFPAFIWPFHCIHIAVTKAHAACRRPKSFVRRCTSETILPSADAACRRPLLGDCNLCFFLGLSSGLSSLVTCKHRTQCSVTVLERIVCFEPKTLLEHEVTIDMHPAHRRMANLWQICGHGCRFLANLWTRLSIPGKCLSDVIIH